MPLVEKLSLPVLARVFVEAEGWPAPPFRPKPIDALDVQAHAVGVQLGADGDDLRGGSEAVDRKRIAEPHRQRRMQRREAEARRGSYEAALKRARAYVELAGLEVFVPRRLRRRPRRWRWRRRVSRAADFRAAAWTERVRARVGVAKCRAGMVDTSLVAVGAIDGQHRWQ